MKNLINYAIKFNIIAIISILLTLVFSTVSFADSKVQSRYTHQINIWHAMGNDFTLRRLDKDKKVREQIAWFQKNKKHFETILARSEPFIHYIYTEIKQRNLPVELALLPVIESAFDPTAVSHRGAAGLWQIMPATADSLGVLKTHYFDGRHDIVYSTTAALDYLSYLSDRFDNNWSLVLAAYNGGEGRVARALARHQGTSSNANITSWQLPLPRETQLYVPRFYALVSIIKHPQRYGFDLPQFNNTMELTRITINTPTSLSKLAEMAETKQDTFKLLNAGFSCPEFGRRSWDTPIEVMLPAHKADIFYSNLAQYTANSQREYIVKQGDTLSAIASNYRSNVKTLQHYNNINGDVIRIGQKITIPPPSSTC